MSGQQIGENEMDKHAAGEWKLQRGVAPVYGADGEIVAHGIGIGAGSEWIRTLSGKHCEHNAARIVACVNACDGMADPVAEIARLRADNARLRGLVADGALQFSRLTGESLHHYTATWTALARAALAEVQS